MQNPEEPEMRIRILTTATYPDGLASTSRIRCYAKALQEQGFEVTIASPSNPRPLKGKKWFYNGIADGISFELLANRTASKNRWMNYALYFFSIYWLVFATILRLRSFDICLLYFPKAWPKVFLLPVLKIAQKKAVLELNEYPYSGEGNRITRYRVAKRFLQGITFRLVMPHVDGIIAISERLEKIARERAPKAKLLRLPILCDKLPVETGPQDKLKTDYLFHAGSLSERKDGIESIVRAFIKAHVSLREDSNVDLKFYITNNRTVASTWQKIQDLLEKSDLVDKLIVTGYLDDDEIETMYARALALIINKPPNEQNLYNFPTKLAPYLSSGTPVVVAARGLEINRFLEDGRNSIVVEPDDVQAISNAIIRCYTTPGLVSGLTMNAKATVKKHFFYGGHRAEIAGFFRSV